MSDPTINPLSAYFRTPKLYVSLPSGGRFYTDKTVEMPPNGELPVFPMTSKDEIMLKNPDALLNGQAVCSLIQSCVPNVKDPMSLYSVDVDALLIAIRGSSGGDQVDVNAACPECKTVTDFAISVDAALSSQTPLEHSYQHTLNNGLEITVVPFTYDKTVKVGIASFESTRSMQSISALTDDMQRLKAFNDSFIKMANLNFEMVAASVTEIRIPNGESIQDPEFIRQFLENTDRDTGKQIQDLVTHLNELGVNKTAEITCSNQECGHTFEVPINFDPVNFFTAS